MIDAAAIERKADSLLQRLKAKERLLAEGYKRVGLVEEANELRLEAEALLRQLEPAAQARLFERYQTGNIGPFATRP